MVSSFMHLIIFFIPALNKYEFKFAIIMSGLKFKSNELVKSCFSEIIPFTWESIEFLRVAFTDSSSISKLRQFLAPSLTATIPKIPEPQPKSKILESSFTYSFINEMHIFVVGWWPVPKAIEGSITIPINPFFNLLLILGRIWIFSISIGSNFCFSQISELISSVFISEILNTPLNKDSPDIKFDLRILLSSFFKMNPETKVSKSTELSSGSPICSTYTLFVRNLENILTTGSTNSAGTFTLYLIQIEEFLFKILHTAYKFSKNTFRFIFSIIHYFFNLFELILFVLC